MDTGQVKAPASVSSPPPSVMSGPDNPQDLPSPAPPNPCAPRLTQVGSTHRSTRPHPGLLADKAMTSHDRRDERAPSPQTGAGLLRHFGPTRRDRTRSVAPAGPRSTQGLPAPTHCAEGPVRAPLARRVSPAHSHPASRAPHGPSHLGFSPHRSRSGRHFAAPPPRVTALRRRGQLPGQPAARPPAPAGPQDPQARAAARSSPSGCDRSARRRTTDLPASTELPAPRPAPPYITIGRAAPADPCAETPRRDYFSPSSWPPGRKPLPQNLLGAPGNVDLSRLGCRAESGEERAAVPSARAEGSARPLSAASADVAGAGCAGGGGRGRARRTGPAGDGKTRRGIAGRPGRAAPAAGPRHPFPSAAAVPAALETRPGRRGVGRRGPSPLRDRRGPRAGACGPPIPPRGRGQDG